MTKITLEDKGQDLLWFRVNESGFVEEAGPFQHDLWQGAYIPLSLAQIGKPCPIHSHPHIIYGCLKYNVESIEEEAI